MKTVLMDSSSAILLFKARFFKTILHYYRVTISEFVYKELTCNEYPGSEEIKKYCNDGLMCISKVSSKNYTEVPLSGGEGEIVVLFQSGTGDFIVIDDRQAMDYCKKLGIPFINALLVPRIFYLSGLMEEPDYKEKTEKILLEGRYSAVIREKALSFNEDDLFRFFP